MCFFGFYVAILSQYHTQKQILMATTFSLQTYQSPSETLINDHISEEKKICIFHRLQLGASFFWIAPLIWLYIHSNLVKALWKDDKAKDIKAPIVLDFTHLKVEF